MSVRNLSTSELNNIMDQATRSGRLFTDRELEAAAVLNIRGQPVSAPTSQTDAFVRKVQQLRASGQPSGQRVLPDIPASVNPGLGTGPGLREDTYNRQPTGQKISGLNNSETRAFLAALGERESASSYNFENKLGFLGKYQFGAETLERLGFVKPGTSASAKKQDQKGALPYGNAILNNPSVWLGKLGVNSKTQWFNNTGAQENAVVDFMNRSYNQLTKNGGILVSDGAQEIAGMLGASHLLGASGAASARSNNWATGVDINGTTAKSYFDLARGAVAKVGGTGTSEDAIPVDEGYTSIASVDPLSGAFTDTQGGCSSFNGDSASGIGGGAGGDGGAGGVDPNGRINPNPTSDDDIVEVLKVGPGFNEVRLASGAEVRRKGARNWRNHNPGNINDGSFTKKRGSLAADPRFAIFPNYATGKKAKEDLLFTTSSYKNKTISQAIPRYAPAFENPTSAYTRQVIQAVGRDAVLSEMTQAERDRMLAAMERIEGFKVGTITVLKPAPATTQPVDPLRNPRGTVNPGTTGGLGGGDV